MKTYTIKPLEFSGDPDEDLFEATPFGTLNIHKRGECWMIRLIPDNEAECTTLDTTEYPTVEAAIAAANETHCEAVERFLEVVGETKNEALLTGWKIQTRSVNGWADLMVSSDNGATYNPELYATKKEAEAERREFPNPREYRVVKASTRQDDNLY